jgi:hypothetical protein
MSSAWPQVAPRSLCSLLAVCVWRRRLSFRSVLFNWAANIVQTDCQLPDFYLGNWNVLLFQNTHSFQTLLFAVLCLLSEGWCSFVVVVVDTHVLQVAMLQAGRPTSRGSTLGKDKISPWSHPAPSEISKRRVSFFEALKLYPPPPPHGATAPSGPGSPRYRGFTITHRHTTLGRIPLDEWSARRRDIYLTTHNTHKRQDIHAPGGIRTRNPSKRSATDSRVRRRGYWDRPWRRIGGVKLEHHFLSTEDWG